MGSNLDIQRLPRRFSEIVIRADPDSYARPQGVQAVLTAEGISISGWHDNSVIIEGFVMNWAEFDGERAALK